MKWNKTSALLCLHSPQHQCFFSKVLLPYSTLFPDCNLLSPSPQNFHYRAPPPRHNSFDGEKVTHGRGGTYSNRCKNCSASSRELCCLSPEDLPLGQAVSHPRYKSQVSPLEEGFCQKNTVTSFSSYRCSPPMFLQSLLSRAVHWRTRRELELSASGARLARLLSLGSQLSGLWLQVIPSQARHRMVPAVLRYAHGSIWGYPYQEVPCCLSTAARTAMRLWIPSAHTGCARTLLPARRLPDDTPS